MVHMSVFSFLVASGINSSITTKTIAPAAKERKYGKKGKIKEVSRIVIIAATGSTAPESDPYKNEQNLLFPSVCNGIEIIAPSGKF